MLWHLWHHVHADRAIFSYVGGRSYLLLSSGRDITDLFTTYHPFTTKPAEVITRYEIGELCSLEFPQYKEDTGFYREVRQEVGAYFKETG